MDFTKIEKKIGIEIPKTVKSFYKLYDFEDFGLELCDENIMIEFKEVLAHQNFIIDEKLLPILDNRNGDFAALYLDSELKGMICILDHDELDSSPKFTSIWKLYESIKRKIANNKNELIDFYELEQDLPLFGNSILEENFFEAKTKLMSRLDKCTNEIMKREISFRILKLVTIDDYDYVKDNFLSSNDMWIQQETINTIKRNLKNDYIKDIFEILEKEKNNPLIETAVMLREDPLLKNSLWAVKFRENFPDIAEFYL